MFIIFQARCATLPSDLQGDAFQSVFGTQQSVLEYILIDKKLKGPTWLNIKNCSTLIRNEKIEHGLLRSIDIYLVPAKTRRSWCKLEYEVDYYSNANREVTNIEINTTILPTPPLVAVTLSLVTLPNTRNHETEVRSQIQPVMNYLIRIFLFV